MSGNLLVYHGKHSDHYWLIDTPARHDAAMVARCSSYLTSSVAITALTTRSSLKCWPWPGAAT